MKKMRWNEDLRPFVKKLLKDQEEQRKRDAELPFSEKLDILDQLQERARIMEKVREQQRKE